MPAGALIDHIHDAESIAGSVDVDAAARAYESAELAFDDAAQQEHADYGRWQRSLAIATAARAYEAAELTFGEAAQQERAHYDRWQKSFGASEVARDEADRAWRAYRSAVAG